MRLCLNMIVKNEAHVIRRCLASVRDHVDYWVIVDTGSTDGTQSIIKEFLKEIPGELHERPWVDFGHNRTEALNLAKSKSDYLLFIDADEYLKIPEGFLWPENPIADAYWLDVNYGNLTYSRCSIVKTTKNWRWEGVLHEYLTSTPDDAVKDKIRGPAVIVTHDGARAKDPDTYKKDVYVLKKALEKEPNNHRYQFYLAQSYRDSGDIENAIIAYRERVNLGGWDEEVWYSKYQIAQLYARKKSDPAIIQHHYLSAYQFRPTRAEPLYALARYHRDRGENYLAYIYSQQAAILPFPSDLLFVEHNIYHWAALDELAVSASYADNLEKGKVAIAQLIRDKKYPESEHQRMIQNYNFYFPGETQCPVCSSNVSTKYKDTPYWICKTCDAWFQSPMTEKVYHADHENPVDEMSDQERQVNLNIARWAFTDILQSKPGKTLDIGSRLPVMASGLASHGCDAWGIDGEPSKDAMGVKMIVADFESWDAIEHEGTFDLITMVHVFEHMYKPRVALEKIKKLLKPTGTLFIRSPDHEVPGFERDLTLGHYTIHPFFHSIKSIQECCKGIFNIKDSYPLYPGQRDTLFTPIKTESVITLNRPGAIGDILMTLNMIPKLREKYDRVRYACHPSYASKAMLANVMFAAGVNEIVNNVPQDAINLIGYPLKDDYPEKPMKRHLLDYFADEMGVARSQLRLPMPDRPCDAPSVPYATLQIKAGWSKYKEWPKENWLKVISQLDFPVVFIDEESGRTLDHSIALIANATMHMGIDSFGNHLTHYIWVDAKGNDHQTKGVIIFGSTQAEASGYEHNTNLTTHLNCQPCFRENPSMSRYSRGPCVNPPRDSYDSDILPACMSAIDVDMVVSAVKEKWEECNK